MSGLIKKISKINGLAVDTFVMHAIMVMKVTETGANTMSKATQTAIKILDTARELGWEVKVRRNASILTIEKRISGNDEFVIADMEYYTILSELPTTSPGSIWGTDGGGIGGISALNSGLFTMNKSGGSKRVLRALAGML